jgi:hypothetical protein
VSREVIIQVTLSGIAYLIVFFVGYWWFTRWFRKRDFSRRDRLKDYVARHPEVAGQDFDDNPNPTSQSE